MNFYGSVALIFLLIGKQMHQEVTRTRTCENEAKSHIPIMHSFVLRALSTRLWEVSTSSNPTKKFAIFIFMATR